jgi:hypothetical protein
LTLEEPFLPGTVLKDHVRRSTDYIYLKFKQFVMADKELSNSKQDWRSRKEDYAVIEPDDGLDPIFRIRQLPEQLFISEAAHKAIDEFNVKQENKDLGIKIKGIRLFRGGSIFDYAPGEDYITHNELLERLKRGL